MGPPDTTTRFEQTVLIHLDAAYNLARWLTRDDDDARDVVQDASLRALKAFGQFRGGNERAWLLTIVRNVAFTFLHGRKPTTELNEDVHQPADAGEFDPPAVLERAVDAERVRDAIEQLPPELRSAIVLREMEGLSYKQIAEISGVPIGTVMSRLSRGRERLAAFLSEANPVGEKP